MAHEFPRPRPNRAGDPEGSSRWWDSTKFHFSDISYLQNQQQLATPQLYHQQHLYHPPVPPPPPPPPVLNQCRMLQHCSTSGASICVSPTAPCQSEQLTTTCTASLYEHPTADSTIPSNHMDLDDCSELVPLRFIDSPQDDLFVGLPPPSPSLLQHQSASVTPVGSETPQSGSHFPLNDQDHVVLNDQDSVVPVSGSVESNKNSKQSKFLASDSARLSSVASSSSVIPPGIFVPPSSPFPGHYGFKLHFPEGSTNTPWTFSQPLNTLFIRPGDDFAVTFMFATPPPLECHVRALVCYGDPVHIQKLGVVMMTPYRDKGSQDCDHSDHFLRCKVPQATYREFYTHKCVNVPVDALPVSECGPFCVYSYACYSGRIVGIGKNKPSLKTIFSVIYNGNEIARDVVTVKCRACPSRDLHKELHGHPKRKANPDADPTEGPPRSKRQRRLATATSAVLPQGDVDPPPPPTRPPRSIPLPPTLPIVGVHGVNLVQDEEPDEDGYYNFVWRVRDRGLYNMLLMLRAGHKDLGEGQGALKKRRREK